MQIKDYLISKSKVPVNTKFLIYLSPLIVTFGDWKLTCIFVIFISLFFLIDNVIVENFNLQIKDAFKWLFLLIWGIYIIGKSPHFQTAVLYYIYTILIPFLTFLLIDNITINKNYLENLFNLFFLSGTILGIYSIYLFIESGFNSLLRIGSIWDDLNIMSAYLMILFMFNLSFILNREKGKKLYLYFISLFFISSGIFMTQTRGVWLSIIVSVLIYTIKRPKIIIPFSLIIGFFIFYFYDAITSRFLTVKNFGADLSSLGRLQAWIATISLLKNNLFFGYGFDSFIYLRDSVIPFFLVPVIHSHNTYLRSLLEIGLIGSIFYYYFFFKAIYFSFAVSKKDATKSYKKFSDGLQLSFIGLVVVFFFEPYFSLFGASTFIIWLLISLSFKIYKNISN